jgi:hypothetical protein
MVNTWYHLLNKKEEVMHQFSRRNFLHTTVLSLGGIMAAGSSVFSKQNPGNHVFVPRMTVNPEIDNLRVVCGVNPAMARRDPTGWDMAAQNNPIESSQVERTLDAMAVSLSRKTDASEAWKTIFRKPQGKDWSATIAAIKVNCIGKNHPRVAVVDKICKELNRAGVKLSNIYIYDGTHDAGPLYSPYVGKGLPEGIVVSDKNKAMGETIKVSIPDKKNGSFKCTRMIADGTVDILVNIAVNKSHDANFGETTLTLKNHAGTFDPHHIHLGGGFDYILAFSKSNALWGGNPVRQQLCIIDSIWGSSKGGPYAIPDKRLDRLVMGTFSGIVDYLTAKKLREPLMGVTHGPIDRFITEFGYAENEMTGWESITV